MRRKHLATSGVLCVAALVLAACGSSSNNSSSSSSSSGGSGGNGLTDAPGVTVGGLGARVETELPVTAGAQLYAEGGG